MATVNAADDSGLDGDGVSSGIAEIHSSEKKFTSQGSSQYAAYNPADEHPGKQNGQVGVEEYRGTPTQQYHQPPQTSGGGSRNVVRSCFQSFKATVPSTPRSSHTSGVQPQYWSTVLAISAISIASLTL